MKYYGKAEAAATSILSAFERGNLPAALAPIFIKRNDGRPCREWSWNNQLICALAGCADPRAFGQWLEVERSVRKGEHARAIILAPCIRKVKETDSSGQERERSVPFAFRGVPVFDVGQTDGAPVGTGLDTDTTNYVDTLPWRGVAESWGLHVDAIDGNPRKPLGWYRHGQAIAVAVRNLSTWCHELIHAADDRLGNLVERGQFWSSETVAELGGAILLCIAGQDLEADLGGCWEYIGHYAKTAEIDALTACTRVLKRTCDAVALILDTAEQLAATSTREAGCAV